MYLDNNILREKNQKLLKSFMNKTSLKNKRTGIKNIAIIDYGVKKSSPYLLSRFNTIQGDNSNYWYGNAVASLIGMFNTEEVTLNSYVAKKIKSLPHLLRKAIKQENKIINISMSGILDITSKIDCNLYYELQKEAYIAHKLGIKIVVSAGNNNLCLDDLDNYKIVPAMLDNVITVGALNKKGNKSNYSNYGKNVNIFVPAGERNIDLNDKLQVLVTTKNTEFIVGLFGTSLAAAIVTGMICDENGGISL